MENLHLPKAAPAPAPKPAAPAAASRLETLVQWKLGELAEQEKHVEQAEGPAAGKLRKAVALKRNMLSPTFKKALALTRAKLELSPTDAAPGQGSKVRRADRRLRAGRSGTGADARPSLRSARLCRPFPPRRWSGCTRRRPRW
jgi:hypothetical protein